MAKHRRDIDSYDAVNAEPIYDQLKSEYFEREFSALYHARADAFRTAVLGKLITHARPQEDGLLWAAFTLLPREAEGTMATYLTRRVLLLADFRGGQATAINAATVPAVRLVETEHILQTDVIDKDAESLSCTVFDYMLTSDDDSYYHVDANLIDIRSATGRLPIERPSLATEFGVHSDGRLAIYGAERVSRIGSIVLDDGRTIAPFGDAGENGSLIERHDALERATDLFRIIMDTDPQAASMPLE